tara:strand:- start:831 stop:944 length:114 start_codon:yes stop_codon:yes gene_type:complete
MEEVRVLSVSWLVVGVSKGGYALGLCRCRGSDTPMTD